MAPGQTGSGCVRHTGKIGAAPVGRSPRAQEEGREQEEPHVCSSSGDRKSLEDFKWEGISAWTRKTWMKSEGRRGLEGGVECHRVEMTNHWEGQIMSTRWGWG